MTSVLPFGAKMILKDKNQMEDVHKCSSHSEVNIQKAMKLQVAAFNIVSLTMLE